MFKLNIAGYALAVLGKIGDMISAYASSVTCMLAFTAIAALSTTPLQGGMNALIASCSEYTFLSQKMRIDGTMFPAPLSESSWVPVSVPQSPAF